MSDAAGLEQQTPTPLVALITGASSGIGAALAMRLARRGHRLMLHAREAKSDSATRLDALLQKCLGAGATDCATTYTALTSEAGAAHLIDRVTQRFGQLDLLVANAGYAQQGGIATSSWESLGTAFAVMPMTFAALLRLSRALLLASSNARVVGVSSFVAERFDHEAPFLETAAAKAALEAIAMSAAAELACHGVTVNCVAPGFTLKDRPSANQGAWSRARQATPLGVVATPDQIAAAIEFLLGPDASHITGTVLRVDGGLTLL